MIIKKVGDNHWEIKTKKTRIFFNQKIGVGEFIIPGPGEYEIAGVEVESFSDIYTFNCENLFIVFISENKKNLSDEELKKIGECDIIFLPVAGAKTMDVKEALKIISEIEPSIVIPIYYQNLNAFTKSEGIKINEVAELKINKNDLAIDARQVYILK